MAFTVDDFDDLVRLLEERPDWRARLRQVLLPRELLELPAVVAQLVETSRATLARLDRVETRLGGVETQLSEVQAALRRLENDVGELRGSTWELRFRVDPEDWFSDLIADPVALSARQVKDLTEQYVAAGRLTEAERSHVRRTDLVIAGREDGEPAYLIVEASRTVSVYDVQRAADRATLLRKAAPRTRAVVAGKLIWVDADELARRRGVATLVEEVLPRNALTAEGEVE